MPKSEDRSPDPSFDRHRIECDLIRLSGQMLYLLGAAADLNVRDRYAIKVVGTQCIVRLASGVKKMQTELNNIATAQSNPPDEP